MILNTYKLIAHNMTSAYMMLKELYSGELTDKQCMFGAGVVQCANCITQRNILPSNFELAFSRAGSGTCGLDIFDGEIYKERWYDRGPQTDIETFYNYVMNIECLFIAETSNRNTKVDTIIKAVISKKNLIYKTCESTMNSNKWTTNKVVYSWLYGIMNFPELDEWKQLIMNFEP